MTSMRRILPGCTSVRAGHQSMLARALCNKKKGESYWLVRVSISKSLSFPFLMHLFTCLSCSCFFFLLTWSLICLSRPLPTFLTSSTPNNLFISNLYSVFAQFRAGPHCNCRVQVKSCRLFSSFLFTLFLRPPLPPQHYRTTWGRMGSLWSNLTPYWFH